MVCKKKHSSDPSVYQEVDGTPLKSGRNEEGSNRWRQLRGVFTRRDKVNSAPFIVDFQGFATAQNVEPYDSVDICGELRDYGNLTFGKPVAPNPQTTDLEFRKCRRHQRLLTPARGDSGRAGPESKVRLASKFL